MAKGSCRFYSWLSLCKVDNLPFPLSKNHSTGKLEIFDFITNAPKSYKFADNAQLCEHLIKKCTAFQIFFIRNFCTNYYLCFCTSLCLMIMYHCCLITIVVLHLDAYSLFLLLIMFNISDYY